MARRSLNSNSLSLADARRIALHAQGFRQQDKSKSVSWARIADTLNTLHLLQIDSVNVLSGWLNLARVKVGRKGNISRELRRAF